MIHSHRQLHVLATRSARLVTPIITQNSRSAPHRRIHLVCETIWSQQQNAVPPSLLSLAEYPPTVFLRSTVCINRFQYLASRSFFIRSAVRGDRSIPDDLKDPPRNNDSTAKDEGPNPAKSSSHESKQSSSNASNEPNDEGSKQKRGKETPPPPPPPHGDKTPWQVFTETLRNEFKASKEWNESTKALASSAHQFTENESIKRAKAAYTAASGAATSKTSSALKSTGKAIGQGAAWTWETPVVRGVRAGVSATGKGLDKVTKPVRETAAFKTVKDVIDDGSSSRYGGWIEKEERRKKRELREMQEFQASGGMRKRNEKIEEDPK